MDVKLSVSVVISYNYYYRVNSHVTFEDTEPVSPVPVLDSRSPEEYSPEAIFPPVFASSRQRRKHKQNTSNITDTIHHTLAVNSH